MTGASHEENERASVWLAELRAAFEPLADTARAAQQSRYMRDRFPFLGLGTPQRRKAQRPILTALAEASGDELMEFASACWREPTREYQYAAADALRKHVTKLDAHHLFGVEQLITTRSWWDTVDSLSPHTVGPMVARHTALVATVDRWIDDPDIWLARSAILHQLFYKETTDVERLFDYVDRRASDHEFFIRKALGWALRQYARTDPETVRAFVEARSDQLSGLTKREALKHL